MSKLGVGVSYLFIFTLFVGVPLFPQTSTATLLGTIRDPSGAVVPGAQVTVRNVDTNIERKLLSNEVGEYVGALLQPGKYEVVIEVPGFKKHVHSGIALQVNQSAHVDVELELGSEEKVVTVEADAPLVQEDAVNMGTVVDLSLIHI